jgi:hypothetical protein
MYSLDTLAAAKCAWMHMAKKTLPHIFLLFSLYTTVFKKKSVCQHFSLPRILYTQNMQNNSKNNGLMKELKIKKCFNEFILLNTM